MSCMMLSPAHIATVAHGLSYLLNQSEMCQLSAADELRDALGACRYPHDFLYDDRRIYPVLYRHNEAARCASVVPAFSAAVVAPVQGCFCRLPEGSDSSLNGISLQW